MITLRQLRFLVKPAVFALVNQRDRKVWVGHSQSILGALASKLEAFHNRAEPSNPLFLDFHHGKLQYKVLEYLPEDKITSNDFKLLKTQDYMDEYVAKGYKLYNKRMAISYKVRIDIEHAPDHLKIDQYYAIVSITNRHRMSQIVGIFNTYDDAVLFQEKYYGTEKIRNIVYAINDLTKQYFCDKIRFSRSPIL